MTCASVQAAAAGLALLGPDDPEHRAALAHAAGCPACTRALARGARLVAALDTLPAPAPPTPEVLARVRRAVEAPARRPAVVATVALGVAAGFLLIGGRHLAHGTHGALAAPLLTLAVALVAAVAAVITRAAWPALVAAGAASVATAVATGDGFTFEMGPGLACLAQEVVAGAIAAGGLWLLDRRHGTRRSAATWAAVAASGALAGQAGLVIHCHVTATGHGLPFHSAGVALAAVLASALTTRGRGGVSIAT